MNRQKLLLFILGIIFLLSLAYSFWRMPQEKTVAQLKYTKGMTPPAAKPADAGIDDRKLHLELLQQAAARPAGGFRKNIFRPIFHEESKGMPPLPPPPPPPLLKAPITPPVAPPPPPQHPSGAPENIEPPAYVKEVGSFTFLGLLQKDNRKSIFLSKNNEIYIVKKGDVIVNKYKVTDITDSALTMNILSEGTEMIIPLEENKALSPQQKK